MKVEREFKLETARALENVSIHKLEYFLKTLPGKEKKESQPPSKWAKYAKTAKAPLTGISEFVMDCSKEIRENFEFQHDRDQEK